MQTPSEILQETRSSSGEPSSGTLARATQKLGALPTRMIALFTAVSMGIFLFLLLGKSWFYFDDFEFLQDAHSGGLALETLFRPIAGHFLPVTRALTWVILLPGEPSWILVRIIILLLYLGACASLWWMLNSSFGNRRMNLLPFTMFATSATVGVWAGWWCVAIQELVMTIAFFNAVGWGLKYLRHRHLTSLMVTYGWWLLGMLAFEKSMVILLVIPVLALAYFCTGGPRQRIAHLWSHYRLAVITTFVLGTTTSVFYVWFSPEAGASKMKAGVILPLLDVMLGKTIWTMLLGGPLKWSNQTGAVVPEPPALYFNLILLTIGLALAWLFAQRRRVGRAVALVGVVFLFAYSLLLVTRAVSMGSALGHLYRYQGEVFLATVLALALALMPLEGSAESSEPRPERVLSLHPPTHLVTVMAAILISFSVVSSVTYYHSWQVFPQRAKSYLNNLNKGATEHRHAVIAGGNVPNDILWAVHGPYTKIENLVRPFNIPAKFEKPTTDLRVVDDKGHLQPAVVAARGQTDLGPSKECGWRVTSTQPATLPMQHRMIKWVWWARLGYMAGTKTAVRVTAGNQTFRKTLPSGLGNLYFPTDGDFDSVRVEVLTDNATICLDRVTVGDAVIAASTPSP